MTQQDHKSVALNTFDLIYHGPKLPFLITVQHARLSEEVLLWLLPFSPLFYVIFSRRELPENPLWPCTNSSLHDTMEQSGHLASVLPPSLYPLASPFSHPQQWHPGQWGYWKSLVLHTHTHTHINGVVTISSLIPNHFSSETIPGTLSPSLYVYSKAVKWNTESELTLNTDPLWPEHKHTHTHNTELSTDGRDTEEIHGSCADHQAADMDIMQ